ncbi:flippase [Halorubrum ezzemoulense]|uniref:Uncharacterized protein n=1 Tax=Halorubrum ezzemoulense TaxID=337243 RepID=A0A256JFC0_HALEZ|nr:flippase [Halorubrum ezzemoulense]OYR67226.1 hypothetical protein DJ78_16285 [Halorubrum ezzemoulense]
MNSLRKSITVILSGSVFRLVVGVLFTPILVRILSQENYGIYAHLMAVIGVLLTLGPLGLFDSVRKHVAEFHEDTEREFTIFVAAIMLSVCYAIAVSIGLLSVNKISYIVSPEFFPLLVLILFSHNIFQVLRGMYYGRRREQIAEIFLSSRKAIYAGAALTFATLGFGVYGVIASYTAALIVVTVAIFVFLVPSLDRGYSAFSPLPTADLNIVGRYGLTQAVGGVSAMLLYKTDILLVEYFGTSTETALYQAALLPAEYIWFVPSAIQMALLQNASYHWSEGNIEQLNSNLHKGLKYAIAALILFGVGLYVLSNEFVLFYYGYEYRESSYPLQILLIGTFFFGISRVFFPVLQATGWIKYTELATVITLLINVALNLLLIPDFGITGAAIATSLSYAFLFFAGILLFIQSEFTLLSWQELLRLGMLLVVFGSSFYMLTRLFNPSPITTLAIFPAVGLFLFITFAFILGVFREAEVAELVEAIRATSSQK